MYFIDIITIFPNIFNDFLETSIVKRAQEKLEVKICIHNLRDYTDDTYSKVDDEPYGGGAGMVMKPEPIIRAIRALRKEGTKVILLSPQGKVFSQAKANDFAFNSDHLLLICGRYEGFDERVINFVDEELSLGDFVLSGGEIPAMAVIEAVTRLLPDVISSKDSFLEDSFFNKNYLDYPQYTRPADFEGLRVPEVLTNGDHQKILDWRNRHSLLNTYAKRKDLLSDKEIQEVERLKETD